jgi:hypothetical protein
VLQLTPKGWTTGDGRQAYNFFITNLQAMLWTARTYRTNYAWTDCSTQNTMYTYCAYIGYTNMLTLADASTFSHLDATDASYLTGKSRVSIYGSNLRSLGGAMVGRSFAEAITVRGPVLLQTGLVVCILTVPLVLCIMTGHHLRITAVLPYLAYGRSAKSTW